MTHPFDAAYTILHDIQPKCMALDTRKSPGWTSYHGHILYPNQTIYPGPFIYSNPFVERLQPDNLQLLYPIRHPIVNPMVNSTADSVVDPVVNPVVNPAVDYVVDPCTGAFHGPSAVWDPSDVQTQATSKFLLPNLSSPSMQAFDSDIHQEPISVLPVEPPLSEGFGLDQFASASFDPDQFQFDPVQQGFQLQACPDQESLRSTQDPVDSACSTPRLTKFMVEMTARLDRLVNMTHHVEIFLTFGLSMQEQIRYALFDVI